MKKILVATALFLGFSTMIFAQQANQTTKTKRDRFQQGAQRADRSPEQRAEMITASLEKKLGLSADQRAKIYAINLERAKQMVGLRDGGQAKDKKDEVRTSLKASDEKILAVLDANQKKTYQDLKADRKESIKDRMQKRGGKATKKA